jgi:hypothetical protein
MELTYDPKIPLSHIAKRIENMVTEIINKYLWK